MSRYGPHREADAPNAVAVLTGGMSVDRRYPRPDTRPMPLALVRQRERINQLAHDADDD